MNWQTFVCVAADNFQILPAYLSNCSIPEASRIGHTCKPEGNKKSRLLFGPRAPAPVILSHLHRDTPAKK